MPVVLAAAALCVSVTVHDGDTIRCGRERVRVANIDAPELPGSPKCQDRRVSYAWCDYRAGEAARVALAATLFAALRSGRVDAAWTSTAAAGVHVHHPHAQIGSHLAGGSHGIGDVVEFQVKKDPLGTRILEPRDDFEAVG